MELCYDYNRFVPCPICSQGKGELWEVDVMQGHAKRAHKIPMESRSGDIEWLKAMKTYREICQVDYPDSASDDSDSSQRSYSSQSSKRNNSFSNQEQYSSSDDTARSQKSSSSTRAKRRSSSHVV